jgi:hypothetical protein
LNAIEADKPKGANLVDMALKSSKNVFKLKNWLAGEVEEAVFFVIDPSTHHELSLGAVAVLHRPVDVDIIVTKLATDFVNLSICPASFGSLPGVQPKRSSDFRSLFIQASV